METSSQKLKESLEEFDKNFHPRDSRLVFGTLDKGNNNLRDIALEMHCVPAGSYQELKQFIKTHTIKLLQAEKERLEKAKYSGVRGQPYSDGYNQALQDQISHLQEQIIKTKGQN